MLLDMTKFPLLIMPPKPNKRVILIMLEPIMLPSASSPFFFRIATMVVMSSGKQVVTLIIKTPIISSLILK